MTGRACLTPRAQSDLDDIWEFSVATWGEPRTEQYLRQLWEAIERLARDPRLGRPRDEVRPGYASYLVGSHVVFYRQSATGIDVVRILHARRDFGRHL